jgi:hypothetical protein
MEDGIHRIRVPIATTSARRVVLVIGVGMFKEDSAAITSYFW